MEHRSDAAATPAGATPRTSKALRSTEIVRTAGSFQQWMVPGLRCGLPERGGRIRPVASEDRQSCRPALARRCPLNAPVRTGREPFAVLHAVRVIGAVRLSR